MNRICRFGLIATAFLIFCGMAQSASAQQKIVVVDITKIFKAHNKFNQSYEAIKKEAELYANFIKSEEENLKKEVESVKGLDPNSPEFKQKEKDLVDKRSKLQVDMNQKGRELSEREAKLFYETYVEVSHVLATYCDARGVSLVIRYNSTKADVKQPATIMDEINNFVIFHQGRDVSDEVIGIINQGAPAAKAAALPTAGPR